MNDVYKKKSAGVLMPLFSMRTNDDWGIGDFDALDKWLDFFASTGTSILQILPVNEMAPGQTCPYNALTAFGIDPVYIAINRVSDVAESQEAQAFIAGSAHEIAALRAAPKAFYLRVRDLKLKTLWFAFKYFLSTQKGSAREQQFNEFKARAGDAWLNDYAMFRALKDFTNWQSWADWPFGIKQHDKNALALFNDQHRIEVEFYKYLQWVLDEQLTRAHNKAAGLGMLIFGDIPFGLNMDSSDVWAGKENFDLHHEVGAPPDQFSDEGQRWGMPAYNWLNMSANNFKLWRGKIQRACELYDLIRLDHMIGFFRTYVYAGPTDRGAFDVMDEHMQHLRGVSFLNMVKEAAVTSTPVAEDLGVIPDYARADLRDLNIAGYKVMRWEKDNGYYREPRHYPLVSIATLSTHDTEPFKLWWDTMAQQERANIWEMCSAIKTDGNVPFDAHVQEVVLRRILDSGSAIAMFSVQDILGSTDRINTPGVVDDNNWTYRIDATPAQMNEKYGAQIDMYMRLLHETGRSK